MQDGIRAKRNAMQLREVAEHALLADRPETAESLRMDRIIGTPPDSLDALAPTAGPESKVSPSLLRAKASVERPRHTRKTPAACIILGMADCNEYGTIYAISSDFGDRITTQHLD